MTEERNWREAKIPQWVKDSIEKEAMSWQLTAALSWPTEAKPAPLPFRWGAYDYLLGEAREGVFWSPCDAYPIHIKSNDGKHGETWQKWAFSRDGENWSTNIRRGPLFETEHDARLYALWEKCEEFAKVLMHMRGEVK